MTIPENKLTEVTKALWGEIYPDRKPWDQLDPDTREEWKRWMQVAWTKVIAIYKDDIFTIAHKLDAVLGLNNREKKWLESLGAEFE